MNRIGLFPGTFDPPTKGHLEIIKKAKVLCDHLIIAVTTKSNKKPLFAVDERIQMLKKIGAGFEVVSFKGLVIHFAKEKKASFLIRGLRCFSDFEYEFQMACANRRLGSIETLFLMADDRYSQISSSLIREIASFQGSLKDFVPPEIEPLIQKKFS